MTENQEQIERLQKQLDRLVRTQIDFQKEVSLIRAELDRLRSVKRVPVEIRNDFEVSAEPQQKPPVEEPYKATTPPPYDVPPPTFGVKPSDPEKGASAPAGAFSKYVSDYAASARSDLEKFIGENLISKIGIIVLVLGVAIGAKYAIDNDLISPLARIIVAYILGLGLVGLAVRLKTKYHNFSAVLVSGGMAIMYFVTYFAYASYSLMDQQSAFGLMAIFTAFTVAAAIIYDRQVIAHIGLVGAYGVPFLLSDNSGNYLFLFTYMAIINAGILAISVRKYWAPLFYTSSGFTWLIFGTWFVGKYSAEHFYLALIFLAVFFSLFYTTKIVHGVMQPESKDSENLICIFITAFVFYSFCLSIIDIRADVSQYTAFFTYLAVISLAILLTSYRFYGRVLIYLSYPFTWLIFGAWFLSKYNAEEHFVLAAVFATVFFAVYYVATLVYRLATDEIGMIENTGLVLTNSFVFYGFGYAIMDSREGLRGFEGLFTAAHALFHSLVAQAVSRLRASAVDVVQVLAVLIITFATIAIPVQFDGNRVTLIWAVEAAALFWFGRARQIRLFEYFSYPIMVLATGSLFVDWITAYADRTMYVSEFNRQPLANGDFITAIVFVAAFAFIYGTNRAEQDEPAIGVDLARLFGLCVAALSLFVLYNTFRIEISNYFHVQIVNSYLADNGQATVRSSYDLVRFNVIWQLNYTMFFLIAVCVVNLRKLKSAALAFTGVGSSVVVLQIFLTVGMYLFYELRRGYVLQDQSDVFYVGPMNIAIRYISYVFAATLLLSIFAYKRDELLTKSVSAKVLTFGFDAIFYSAMFIVASCELVNLMGQFHISDSTKFGLSILWGVFALAMIVIGIAWNRKHLRIAAIVLLGVTLAKLFLYDVADLPTIPKTILFVSLGLLMLIISFLYAKYKKVIFTVNENPDN